jgi:formate hydrogenlyase transcriptional activator
MQDKPQNPFPAPETLQTLDTVEISVLRAIVEGTAKATGEEFFRSLVSNLSIATGVANAFIAEFAETETRVRTLAFWMNGQLIDNQEWDLAGTPCEDVLRGNFCHHPSGVWKQFPKEEGIESYLGVPLHDAGGDILGHLAIFDNRMMPSEPRLLFTFQIFAARAAAELSRIRAIERLRQSEERFRDLFDEAPIAYVHEDVESRFIRANRAAMRILGITPEQVPAWLASLWCPTRRMPSAACKRHSRQLAGVPIPAVLCSNFDARITANPSGFSGGQNQTPVDTTPAPCL